MSPSTDGKLEVFDDARAFSAVAAPLLYAREAENNLSLGILEGALARGGPFERAGIWRTPDSPPAVFLQTPGRNLILADGSPEAFRLLAGALEPADLPGVCGQVDAVHAFTAAWTQRTGIRFAGNTAIRLHQLRSVENPRPAPGSFRPATLADADRLTSWVQDFDEQVGNLTTGRHPRAFLEERIPHGRIFLWETDWPVSMAATARDTRNITAINYVFTPPAFRGLGFASNLVARLSRHLLERGRRSVVLFTDLANATSNKIYHAVGFRPLEDQIVLTRNAEGPGR